MPTLSSRSTRGGRRKGGVSHACVLEKAFRREEIRVSSRVYFLNERNAIYAPSVRREKGGNALTKVYASVQIFRLSRYIRLAEGFVDVTLYVYMCICIACIILCLFLSCRVITLIVFV